jgi:aryl-alcohol dehydrogenase-like predicted oxidoreductase
MRRRRIGALEVSVVGLGGNSFGTDFFGARCDQGEVIVGSVVAGVTKCEQVLVNAAAADWEISADTLGAIDGIVAGEL